MSGSWRDGLALNAVATALANAVSAVKRQHQLVAKFYRKIPKGLVLGVAVVWDLTTIAQMERPWNIRYAARSRFKLLNFHLLRLIRIDIILFSSYFCLLLCLLRLLRHRIFYYDVFAFLYFSSSAYHSHSLAPSVRETAVPSMRAHGAALLHVDRCTCNAS